MSWLDPVRAALDEVSDACPIFFRDDDAGWGDDRLLAMLDRFDRHLVPVDVAVIPAVVTSGLVDALSAYLRKGTVRVHQHGYAHVNHEPEGRKCEFGPARDLSAQLLDIANGRQLLDKAFGDDAVDPIFTPPWNRCSPDAARALAELGISVLSRDATAGRLDQPGVAEVPITVDWFGKRKGVPLGRAGVAAQIAAGIRAGGPVGLMLHHAVTDDAELDRVEHLLELVAAHPRAMSTTIAALAAPPSHQSAPPASAPPASAQ